MRWTARRDVMLASRRGWVTGPLNTSPATEQVRRSDAGLESQVMRFEWYSWAACRYRSEALGSAGGRTATPARRPQPALTARPTIAGLCAGQDEVLEQGLRYLERPLPKTSAHWHVSAAAHRIPARSPKADLADRFLGDMAQRAALRRLSTAAPAVLLESS
jgi:hypothetical protein